MTTTTTNGQGAPFNEENTSFNGEDAFMDGLEKLAGILNRVADKFDKLAGSYGTSEEESEELNDGETEDGSIDLTAGETEDDDEEMDADEAEDEAGYENVFGALKNLNLFTGSEQILAKLADPLVKALDSMSAILEDANEKIMDMVFEEQPDAEESE